MKVAYKAISRLNESQTQKAMSLNLVSRDIKMALQDVVGNLVVLSSVVPGLAVPMIPLPRDTSTSTSTNAIPTSTSSAATATCAVSSNSPASLVAQAVTTTVSNTYLHVCTYIYIYIAAILFIVRFSL